MHKRFNIRLIPEDDGHWTAEVPALPGCATWGSTREQAIERIKEAIELYLGIEEEAVAKFDGVLRGKLLVPEPQPDKVSEDAPGDACVNSCVTNNVITFPTGAQPKKKTRNRLRA
jgi:predicted RNase H-like HicB family nuclease